MKKFLSIVFLLMLCALIGVLSSCTTGSTLSKEGRAALNQQISATDTIYVLYDLGQYTGGSPEDPKVYGEVPKNGSRIALAVAENLREAWPDKQVIVAERGTVQPGNDVVVFVDVSAVLSYPMSYFKTVCSVYTRDGGWFQEESEGIGVYLGVDERYWNDSLSELESIVDEMTHNYIRRIKKSS